MKPTTQNCRYTQKLNAKTTQLFLWHLVLIRNIWVMILTCNKYMSLPSIQFLPPHYILYPWWWKSETFSIGCLISRINPLTPNDHYSGRTAPLTSKHCILYIYSTNIGTEYFKYGVCSPFFPLQNAVCFIILTYLVLALFTFYIQGVLKLKK